jgi:hypothetical protein
MRYGEELWRESLQDEPLVAMAHTFLKRKVSEQWKESNIQPVR